MNYFDGIKAVREEQNAYYDQLLQSQYSQKTVTNQMVQKTR